MSIQDSSFIDPIISPQGPILISSDSEQTFEIAAATTNPTHHNLGPKLLQVLDGYIKGSVIIEDPDLNRIFTELVIPDRKYPEMLATYFSLLNEVSSLRTNPMADRQALIENDRILSELKLKLQRRMDFLTNRDLITSGIITTEI